MATIDADAHVMESEHTWAYMEPAERKYQPALVTPNGAVWAVGAPSAAGSTHVIDECGHAPHREKPQEFLEVTRRLLSTL